MLSEDFLRSLPKVLLHEHLDGGLRPQTVIDLAVENGYTGLPFSHPEELAVWFHRGAQRGQVQTWDLFNAAKKRTGKAQRASALGITRG